MLGASDVRGNACFEATDGPIKGRVAAALDCEFPGSFLDFAFDHE
jgi:hypothetical protein